MSGDSSVPTWMLTFSAFMVAEVTISLRSRRRERTAEDSKFSTSRTRGRGTDALLRRSPMRMSVLRDRS